MYNPIRKWTQKGLAILLALVLMTPIFLVQSNAYGVDGVDYTRPESELPSLELGKAPASTTGASFTNTSDDGGEDWISMTNARSFEAIIPVDMSPEEADAAIKADKIKWTLSRTESYLSTELYPNYKKSIDLTSWQVPGTGVKNPDGSWKVPPQTVFNNIVTGVYTIGADTVLKVKFDCASYYSDNSVPHGGGSQTTMDYIGWYSLAAQLNGENLGSVAAKVVPYDKFRTMGEVYDEMDALANQESKYYVEEFSMGKSEMGYDMPYLIVAKDDKVVDKWLNLCDRAENEPAQVLAELNAGTLGDYQVPVMFSNVHSNETVSTDSILEFGTYVVNNDTISYDMLESFTSAGEDELEAEMGPMGEEGSVAVPDLVSGAATYLGYLKVGNETSGHIKDMDKYYNIETKTVDVSEMLDDVFFILVPEENVEGRIFMTRAASGGLDLNRDNSFQTQNETVNMTKLIGEFNPVCFTELHGRITDWQIEPCTPPHEPNFEYDLLAKQLMKCGEAFGRAAVVNNDSYNSYVTPMRDYLYYTGRKTSDKKDETYWAAPWDDMSTSYTPQWAMLHGTVSYTVEQPAYNDAVAQGSAFGQLGQADYVAANKAEFFKAQLGIYERGVTNANSDAYDKVGQWLSNQYDVEGAENELFRPEYDKPGQNGNFYPECYIIPLDRDHQTNLQAANAMVKWLSRNDVKILLTEKPFSYKDVTYPAGTMIISMYQAKRSVANGALYDGTFINHWSALYSEGITSFNETRGFDMAVCAEPAAYTAIKAACGLEMDYQDCLDHLSKVTSSLANTGNNGYQVIISNASEDSAAAVNALLKDGRKVGMITEGTYQGDFICSYDDWVWLTASDGPNKDSHFILSGTCIDRGYPAAKIITKNPIVYIAGTPADATSGYIHSTQVNSSNYNYDRQALDLMNFATTKDVTEADVIIGATAIGDVALKSVWNGTPYIGYGSSATKNSGLNNFFDGITRTSVEGGSMDALPYVTYPSVNLINASYVMDGDDVMYGYGAGYFESVPSGASILVRVDPTREPTEGFIRELYSPEEYYGTMLPLASEILYTTMPTFLNGSIQGFSYKGKDKSGNNIDVALFANSLTHKVNQRDEYAFISNFAFSNVLGDNYTASEYSSGSTGSGSHSHSGSSSPATATQPAVTAPATSFTDIDRHWAKSSIEYVVGKKLFSGVSDRLFGPDETMTRGMLVTVLGRAYGLDTASYSAKSVFTDVPSTAYYAPYVAWAYEKKIVSGVGEGLFAPDKPVTRGEMAAIITNYMKFIGKGAVSTADLTYADAAGIDSWGLEGVKFVTANGLMTGISGNSFDFDGLSTRAQVATVIERLTKLIAQ